MKRICVIFFRFFLILLVHMHDIYTVRPYIQDTFPDTLSKIFSNELRASPY
jgi:hypothetical protein